MKTLEHLIAALAELNSRFPRPGIPPLEVSERFAIPDDCIARSFPHASDPGVYVFFGPRDEVLYVGSSVGLGRRLGGGYLGRKGDLKDEKIAGATALRTIRVPSESFFEAMAVEAFLIRRLQPPRNTNLK